MTNAYEVRNVRKIYPAPYVVANDGLSFTVGAGEAFGLLGANGAGKSTLVRQLVGLLTPTAGEIRLFGEVLQAGRHQRRIGRTVAYLPQGAAAFGELRVAEAVVSLGVLRGLRRARAADEADHVLERLGIADLRDRPIRRLSGGERRLTEIAMTLAGRLPVLVLDEPTADIDPALRKRVWSAIAERAASGSSVILVTHDVAEAEHVLDRVAIISDGKLTTLGTPAELKARLAHRTRIEVLVAEGAAERVSEAASVVGDGAVVHGRRVSAWVPAEDSLVTLEKVMSTFEEGSLEDVRLVTPTLEDVYLDASGNRLSRHE